MVNHWRKIQIAGQNTNHVLKISTLKEPYATRPKYAKVAATDYHTTDKIYGELRSYANDITGDIITMEKIQIKDPKYYFRGGQSENSSNAPDDLKKIENVYYAKLGWKWERNKNVDRVDEVIEEWQIYRKERKEGEYVDTITSYDEYLETDTRTPQQFKLPLVSNVLEHPNHLKAKVQKAVT